MSKTYEIVPFHEYQFLALREHERVAVALKPMVETIGLDWSAQRKRVMRHPVLSEGVAITAIPSGHGDQETVMIDLKMLPGFLVTIAADRIVNAEVRERVILFQREAFQVLFDHFFGGKGAAAKQVTATAGEAIKLLDAIKRATIPAERQYLHAMLAQLSDARGLPLPPLDELVEPDPFGELALQLFERIEAMIGEGALPEHHRREDRIAFTTRELRSAGLHLTGDQRHALKQHPRFIATCKVNCRDGQSRHCWVFSTPTQDDALASALRYEPINGARP